MVGQDQRAAGARAAGTGLRPLAGAGAGQALLPPPCPWQLPRLLGLRWWRPGGHGAALPRPGAVSARQGRHQSRGGRSLRALAAARRRGRALGAGLDEVRRRLHTDPRVLRVGRAGDQGQALHRGPERQGLPRLPHRSAAVGRTGQAAPGTGADDQRLQYLDAQPSQVRSERAQWQPQQRSHPLGQRRHPDGP